MFGRNHFVTAPKSRISEDLSSRYAQRIVDVNVLDDDGNIVVKHESSLIDLSKPQTPQSGIECCVNDLSFCISHNMPLPSGSSGLSFIQNTNPLQSFRAVKALSDAFENSSKPSKSE